VPDLNPVTGHLLRASQHIQEDIGHAIADLTPELLWAKPRGLSSAGFHAKHLAGSTGRLCTYLEGGHLTPEEVQAISAESSGAESAAELLSHVQAVFDRYERAVWTLRPEDFGEIREIGRKRIQTTAVSLAIHIVEHGHRHVGQAIAAAKLARAMHV
jgi:uncharacterized damage-inducible protein DinB